MCAPTDPLAPTSGVKRGSGLGSARTSGEVFSHSPTVGLRGNNRALRKHPFADLAINDFLQREFDLPILEPLRRDPDHMAAIEPQVSALMPAIPFERSC